MNRKLLWTVAKRFAFLGVLVLLTLFIFACGDDGDDDAAPAATTAPAATAAPTMAPTAAAPRPVAPRLLITMPAPAGQVTCHCETFQSAGGHLHNLHDYMVGLDPVTGVEEPTHLGTDWEVDDTGKNWTFKLRPNISFYQDGQASEKYTFSAEDVVHTWEVMAGKKGESNPAGDWTPMMDSVEEGWTIVNDYEIQLHHKLIELELPFRLSEEWTFGVQDLEYFNDIGGLDAYKQAPMGTGAFSFVEKSVNQHIIYKANKPHWRKTPEFDELKFLWTPESATRVAQLIAGEAHIAEIPRDLQDEIIEGGMKIQKSTLPSFHVWIRIPYYQPDIFKTGEPTPNFDENDPIRDPKVRHALNVAIDRNLINNKFFKGSGIPDPVEFFPPWRADCKDEWAPNPGPDGGTGCAGGGWPYPYDPQMGRDLLAEAGYPEGFDLTFYASPNLGGVPEIPDVAEAMAAMWGEIGVNVDLQVAQSDVVRSLQTAHDWTGSVNLVRYSIDPVSLSMSFLWRKATRAFMEHEFITEWKEAYDQTLDPDTRFAESQRLGDYFHNEHLTVPLIWLFAEVGFNPNVVVDYEISMLHFGPVRYHEYTKAVMQ